MSDDRPRPIPHGPPGDLPPEDDVYIVDTRGRRPAPRGRATRPRPAPHHAPRQTPRKTPQPASRPAPADRTPGRPSHPRGAGARDRAAGRPGPRPRPAAPPRRPGPSRARRLGRRLVIALVLVLVYLLGVPLLAYREVTRVDATPDGERPGAGKGSNYLLLGTDSREGLTAEQQEELATGSEADAAGNRSDTIMILHRSTSGPSSLISIPRDSYVEIPGHGRNKINAAFALGGPELMAATIEHSTGLRLDGYLEIGFGGFAGIVQALGGVHICVETPMDDPMAGIDLQAGCQDLSGPQALGYVRSRYVDPRGDIGRAERQRQFLSAVVKKIARPATILWPPTYWEVTHAGARGVRIGEDTSMLDTARLLMTMRSVSSGDGHSLVVPLRTLSLQTSAGVAVQWDRERALALFEALKRDDPLTAPPAGTDGTPSGG